MGLGAGAVAGRQFGTIKSQRPISNVQPCATARLDFMGDSLAFFETDTIDIHVLMDRCRSVTAIGRDNQHLGRLRVLGLRMPLSVTRGEATLTRLNPNLQEVQRFGGRRIELAVGNTLARAHQLNASRFQLPSIPHAILVLQCPFQHVAEDFHVTVRVCTKPLSGGNAVIIDDP